MITHLNGKISEITPAYVVIECGGVGYMAHISLHTFEKIKSAENTLMLFTYLSIKEDAHTLYGFAEDEERKLFKHLISVNGIGANTARMMLSSLHPTEITKAILDGNSGLLQKIKGIGTKTAQRVVIDLRDKLMKVSTDTTLSPIGLLQNSNNKMREEALSALITLGFVKNNAEKAIDQIIKQQQGELSIEKLIKAALQQL